MLKFDIEIFRNFIDGISTERTSIMAQEKVTPPKAETSKEASVSVEKKQTVKTTATKPANESPVKKAEVKKTAPKKVMPKKKVVAKKATTKKAAVKKTVTKKKPTAKKVTAKKPITHTKARNTGNNNTTMEKIMSQGKVNFEKLTNDASEMGRENVEAMMKSTQIFAKGFEDMMRTAMSFAQTSAEKQSKFVQQVMGSKTLHEFTEVQNKIAQANFDDFMSGATKLTEMSVKTLNESIEPINSQVTKGMQKATKSMAA